MPFVTSMAVKPEMMPGISMVVGVSLTEAEKLKYLGFFVYEMVGWNSIRTDGLMILAKRQSSSFTVPSVFPPSPKVTTWITT